MPSGGGGGGFTSNPLPAGSAGLPVDQPISWGAQASATGWMVFFSDTSRLFADAALYASYYYISSGATLSLPLSGVQAGTWFIRVAPIQGSVMGDLGNEFSRTTA